MGKRYSWEKDPEADLDNAISNLRKSWSHRIKRLWKRSFRFGTGPFFLVWVVVPAILVFFVIIAPIAYSKLRERSEKNKKMKSAPAWVPTKRN